MTSWDTYTQITFADQIWSFGNRVTLKQDARNHITITPIDGRTNHVGPPVELDEQQAVALRDWLVARLCVNNPDAGFPGV